MSKSYVLDFDHPSLVSFEISNRCNFQCIYCYNNRIIDKKKVLPRSEVKFGITPPHLQPEMTLEEIREHLIPQIDEMKFDTICFIGGEPMLRFDDLIALAPDIKKNTKIEEIMLSTNGYFITKEKLKEYRKAYKPLFTHIAIPLDSLDKEIVKKLRPPKEDVFERTLEAIDLSLKMGFFVSVEMVVNQYNFHEMERMMEWVKRKGSRAVMEVFTMMKAGRAAEHDDLGLTPEQLRQADRIKIRHYGNPIIPWDNMPCPFTPSRWEKIKPTIRQLHLPISQGCSAGNNFFNIDHAGNIFPCNYLPDYLGNVMNDPHELKNIWDNHPIVQKLRNREVGGKCGTCKHRIPCGGCRARARTETGDLFGGVESCEIGPDGHVMEQEATKILMKTYRKWKAVIRVYYFLRKLHLV
ncbi:MAG: radical SAM protein [Promethearchaeota archaeon]